MKITIKQIAEIAGVHRSTVDKVLHNRTNKEVANAGSVLDGNIDPFINAYLTWISTGKTEE